MRCHRLGVGDFLFTGIGGVFKPNLKKVFLRIGLYVFKCNCIFSINCINRLCLSLALNRHLLALSVGNKEIYGYFILFYITVHLCRCSTIIIYMRRERSFDIFELYMTVKLCVISADLKSVGVAIIGKIGQFG